MEAMIKKYQQKFKRVKEDMNAWEQLQSRLLSQFRNASSIIERLKVIQDVNNYGSLKYVDGFEDALLRKQMESLENLLLSMKITLEELHGIVLSLEKLVRDGKQLVRGGSSQSTMKQLQLRIGVKPSLADCLNGLRLLHEMHHSEYLLKVSVVGALPALALKPCFVHLHVHERKTAFPCEKACGVSNGGFRDNHPTNHQDILDNQNIQSTHVNLELLHCSVNDLSALQILLVDQPNIPKDEVQFIFDIIFAEEIS